MEPLLSLSKEGVFLSMSGEHGSIMPGKPCFFIRLAGCNLACPYCDANHAHHSYATVEEIVRRIGGSPVEDVLITGGEPLLQMYGVIPLVQALRKDASLRGVPRTIQIETNGTITPGHDSPLYQDVDVFVVDLKDNDDSSIWGISTWAENINRIEGKAPRLIVKAVCDMSNLENILEVLTAFEKAFANQALPVGTVLSLSPVMPPMEQCAEWSEEHQKQLRLAACNFMRAVHRDSHECRIVSALAFNVQLHKILGIL